MLVSPAGARYPVDTSAGAEALTAASGQRSTLPPASTVQHHDESPLHPLTTSSVAAIEPGVRSIRQISYCLKQARSTLDLADDSHHAVADSVALGATRLAAALDPDDLVSAFV